MRVCELAVLVGWFGVGLVLPYTGLVLVYNYTCVCRTVRVTSSTRLVYNYIYSWYSPLTKPSCFVWSIIYVYIYISICITQLIRHHFLLVNKTGDTQTHKSVTSHKWYRWGRSSTGICHVQIPRCLALPVSMSWAGYTRGTNWPHPSLTHTSPV